MTHKNHILTAAMLALALFSLTMLPGCTQTNSNEDAVGTTSLDTITSTTEETTTDNGVPTTITIDDVKECLSIINSNSDFKTIDNQIYDFDFDGFDEVLVLADVPFRAICVFEKENGKMVQGDTIGMGSLNYVESMRLYTYSGDDEKYPYFTFHFDDGGVMKCDVVAAIKHEQEGYTIDYLLSYGTLTYSDIPEPFTKEFYRIGWGQTDIAMDGDYNDISKEEFLKIYEKYTDLSSHSELF